MNPLKRQFLKKRHYVLSTSTLIIASLLFTMCSKSSEQEKPSNPAPESKQTALSKPFKTISRDCNWPSFRGVHAAGVLDEQNLPESWNVQNGENIIWKTLIPGLAHSSPIIWDDKLFVTTAISSREDASFRHGLYGDGDASDDLSPHRWVVYCLNKNTGEILWERTATEGVPKDKRHIKSTYANSTPATDGRYVVALFGSQGLFAYTLDGDLVWEKDLGRMNCGAYDAPHLEWGPASSPIIYRDMVIIQNDTSEEDFIIACDIKTGETIWKTKRDELPAWGTPTIVESKEQTKLVINSSNYIYGYDAKSGNELWRLGGSSQITAPTPIFSDSIIIVCSGRRPEAPIFAIKTEATGDITLEQDQTHNEFVLWSKTKCGPYMPTPIIYHGYFYTCSNSGRFRCYELVSGDEIYSERLPHRGGGFSASPVASDDRLFIPNEDGDIFVVRAGPKYELLSTNDMGELLMASPAISDGKMYVRAEDHLFAIGQ